MKHLQRRFVRVAVVAVAVLGWGIGEASASLVNPSFESDNNLFGVLPQVFGVWGDDISSIVTGEQGVTPRTGSGVGVARLSINDAAVGGPRSPMTTISSSPTRSAGAWVSRPHRRHFE